MLKGSDFVLNPEKLEKEFQLVEISEWVDYNSKEKLGFHYSVILPKLRFEKLKVSIKGTAPITTKEELERHGTLTVTFDGLVIWASYYNNRFLVKAEASAIHMVKK